MAKIEDEISEWLGDNDLDNCKEPPLNDNDLFVAFLKKLFSNKTEEIIKGKIHACCIGTKNLSELSSCLSKGLS